MKTFAISCSSLLVLLFAVGGCGGRARTTPPPATDVAKPAEKAGEADEKPGAPGVVEEISLPGQDRYYPSEDPRNRPRSGGSGLTPSPVPKAAPASASPSVPGARPQEQPTGSGYGDLELKQLPPAAADVAPPPVPKGESRFRVQVLASAVLNTAMNVRKEVSEAVDEPVFVEWEREIWKVRVGDLPDRVEADAVRRHLMGLGYDDAFVVEARGR